MKKQNADTSASIVSSAADGTQAPRNMDCSADDPLEPLRHAMAILVALHRGIERAKIRDLKTVDAAIMGALGACMTVEEMLQPLVSDD